jgi:alpha-glucoside transport system substrate-binding protein
MEAGTATGWQATDWLEDIMLRTTSVENYNKWITHELPFNSPEVLHAMDLAGQIFFTEGSVFGGPEGAIAIHQTDPMDPMFPANGAAFTDSFTPGCWMQKQATWYGPDFFPDVKANPGSTSAYKIDAKSTVWYPIKAFEAAGYQVPTTLEELLALSQRIVDEGKGSPWCIGMGAEAATGWQATDWVEDVVLRSAGIDAYSQWITHDLAFNSPEIKAAFDEVAKIFFTEGYVLGGNTGIIATTQTEPMDPMFPPDGNWEGFTPGCWMQKQATWYGPDFFPDQRTTGEPSQYVLGEDIGIFYFPAGNPENGTPALFAGDALLVPAPPDGSPVRDAVKAVAQFLSTPQGVEAWIKAGSAISANTTTPQEWYEGFYKLKVASEIFANATALGFDASDLMPASVGAGTFWSKAVEWINNNGADTEAILQAIDDSWPM